MTVLRKTSPIDTGCMRICWPTSNSVSNHNTCVKEVLESQSSSHQFQSIPIKNHNEPPLTPTTPHSNHPQNKQHNVTTHTHTHTHFTFKHTYMPPMPRKKHTKPCMMKHVHQTPHSLAQPSKLTSARQTPKTTYPYLCLNQTQPQTPIPPSQSLTSCCLLQSFWKAECRVSYPLSYSMAPDSGLRRGCAMPFALKVEALTCSVD